MSNVIPFNYRNHEVRTVVDEQGDPWWVAKDVCAVLGHTNPSVAIDMLDLDERAKKSLGRQGEAWVISESGLYTLILRSNKPEAKPFRKWVTSEVLPSIRKHGYYATPETEIDSFIKPAQEFKASLSIAKAILPDHNQAVLSANRAVKNILGYDVLETYGITHLIAEQQEIHLTASDLGKQFGMSGQKMNKLLEELELQESYRDHKNRNQWRPTEKGKPHVILKDTGKKHSDGTPVTQRFFLESIKGEIPVEAVV